MWTWYLEEPKAACSYTARFIPSLWWVHWPPIRLASRQHPACLLATAETKACEKMLSWGWIERINRLFTSSPHHLALLLFTFCLSSCVIKEKALHCGFNHPGPHCSWMMSDVYLFVSVVAKSLFSPAVTHSPLLHQNVDESKHVCTVISLEVEGNTVVCLSFSLSQLYSNK